LEKFEEANQEYKRHISVLERSIEEHKRLIRKREKELEQMRKEFEHNTLNASSLNNKVFSFSHLIISTNILLASFFSVLNKMLK
jgi:predicted RNase H-like nuclease (RuvC/YqgF family)